MKRSLSFFILLFILTASLFVGCNTERTQDQYPEANPASDFEYTVNEEENYSAISKYIGTAKIVVIPKKLGGATVKAILPSAFEGTDITSLIMPESIFYIGDASFKNCHYLQAIEFSKNIKTIGNKCFENCTSLKEAILPSKLIELGNESFKNCTSLEKVFFPKSISKWGEESFFGDIALTTIIFQEGIENIGSKSYACFGNCTSIKELTIPASVKSFYGTEFWGCSSLSKVVFKGDAPTISKETPPFNPPGLITIYYDPETSGWENSIFSELYKLVQISD